MREIKFRAWLKDEKRMTNVVRLDLLENDDNDICIIYRVKPYLLGKKHSKDFELMQYAGLKDKNGVKIFEGDIVRCDDEICTIVWDEPYVTYAVSSKENGNDSLGNFEPKDLEVIGNIYENKELLGWFDE